MSIREQLRALYESNVAGARQLGAWWAIDHYYSMLRELDEHPRGPLTAAMRADVERFGSLIR